MALSVLAGFQGLRSNLEITGLQSSTASTRQTEVRACVERSLTVLDSFLAGSYARSTMISPLKDADIDIFMVLDPSYYSVNTPAALLEKVRAALKVTYPTTPSIRPDGQAVATTFSDFRVDVVPAFYRTGGGFLIPNSNTGGWIPTDPRVHATALTTANKAHNGDLVPLVKMIRAWNRQISRSFSGFYLELMTTDILNNVTISNFPSGVRYVLYHGQEKVKLKQRDPAGFDNWVNPFSSVETVSNAVSRFSTACNRAYQAELFENAGNIRSATDEWRKIFGDYFPAYG